MKEAERTVPCFFLFLEKRIWENQKKQRKPIPCFFLFMAAESRQDALFALYIRKRGNYYDKHSV